MKIIFVFSVCCLALALADWGEDETKKRENAIKECQGELKLTDEQAKETSNLGCLYACMHKKTGYLKADGTLNFKAIGGGLPNKRFEEQAQKVYQKCTEEAKGDSCKFSLCLENTKGF